MAKKILLAEDDQGIIQVVQMILESSGFQILTATNDKELGAILKKEKPALLLLDIGLGGTDGGKLARKIKQNYGDKLPIVIVSANSETEQIAKESGVDDFLLKPFDIDTLLKTVKKYCK